MRVKSNFDPYGLSENYNIGGQHADYKIVEENKLRKKRNVTGENLSSWGLKKRTSVSF